MQAVEALIAPLADAVTERAVRAERAMNEVLGGGCHAPIAAFATERDGMLSLHGLVGRLDGTEVIAHRASGATAEPEALGGAVATALEEQGASRLLAEIDAGR